MPIEEGRIVYFSVHYGGNIHKGRYLGQQECVPWPAPANRVKIEDNFGKTSFQVGQELRVSQHFKMITVDPYLDESVDEETVEWIMNHRLPGYMEKIMNDIDKKEV